MASHQTSEKTTSPLLEGVGATGNQGKPILHYFSSPAFQETQQQPFRLRGVTRNVNSPAAQELIGLGVEMVCADLNDTGALRRAFTGATHIFANTDSNQAIAAASRDHTLLAPGQTPIAYAAEMELAQGKNIIAAARAAVAEEADAATTTTGGGTLQRFVWSSLPSPKKWSRGKYTKLRMFDVKEELEELMRADDVLGPRLSVLWVGFYATNALRAPAAYAPQKQEDGTFVFSLPTSDIHPIPMADLEVDMGPWTAALFQDAPGTLLVGATSILTWQGWLTKWAAQTGTQARWEEANSTEFAAKVGPIAEGLLEEFAFIDEFGFTGGNPKPVFPDDLRHKGIYIRESSMDAQIARADWSGIL